MEPGVAKVSFSRKKLLVGIILSQLVLLVVVYHVYGPKFFPSVNSVPVRVDENPRSNTAYRHVLLDEVVTPSPKESDQLIALVPTAIDVANDQLTPEVDPKTVAIGMGLTTRKAKDLSEANVQSKMVFFTTLMPSFCKTASKGYKYHFFIAFDYNDGLFTKLTFQQAFNAQFIKLTEAKCPKESTYQMHFVTCAHTRSPAWAQNDAMIQAYLMNMAYYYRINDDTTIKTSGWTEAFINRLTSYIPPNVGVVGPHHSGGNTAILTYDFVSSFHVEVFGFYYPRIFQDWHGDRWISEVYKPGRMSKLKDMLLQHTMGYGQRYSQHRHSKTEVQGQIAEDKLTLVRYLELVNANKGIVASPQKVVSMSLHNNWPNTTLGAVRNAQLMRLYYPSWTLRVYMADNNTIPAVVVNKLLTLGVQIKRVSKEIAESLPPKAWKFLVIDDPTVATFLIRSTTSRISMRENRVVSVWLEEDPPKCLHCIRDHPTHAEAPLVDGLWGGVAACIREKLGIPIEEVMRNHAASNSFSVHQFLFDFIWKKFNDNALCHDSVSCKRWNSSVAFPFLRTGTFVGAPFAAMELPMKVPGVLTGATPDECNLNS